MELQLNFKVEYKNDIAYIYCNNILLSVHLKVSDWGFEDYVKNAIQYGLDDIFSNKSDCEIVTSALWERETAEFLNSLRGIRK